MTDQQATPELDLSDLPQITAKQLKFVHAVAADGKSYSEAYRHAYDCNGDVPATAWHNASVLASDSKVSAWLQAVRRLGMAGAKLNLSGHLTELERLKHISLDTGNCGAAVKAEELRGKASGLYVDRIETRVAGETELLAALRALPANLQLEMAVHYGVAHLIDEPLSGHAADTKQIAPVKAL